MKLKLRHYFDSAHCLVDTEDLFSKECANLHGHTYAVDVEVETNHLNKGQMVIDFKKLKSIIDVLDHKMLNDVFKEYGYDMMTTAENTAKFIYDQIQKNLTNEGKVISVAVNEGYKGEDKGGWVVYSK